MILKTGGPDYLPLLLIGLTLWQWMKSCITHGGYAIWMNLPLIRQVRLPPLVFPLVQMLADTVKFFYIFALLLVILWCVGYPPNPAYFALPLVFARGVPRSQPARASSSPRWCRWCRTALRDRAGADGRDVPVRRRVLARQGAVAAAARSWN